MTRLPSIAAKPLTKENVDVTCLSTSNTLLLPSCHRPRKDATPFIRYPWDGKSALGFEFQQRTKSTSSRKVIKVEWGEGALGLTLSTSLKVNTIVIKESTRRKVLVGQTLVRVNDQEIKGWTFPDVMALLQKKTAKTMNLYFQSPDPPITLGREISKTQEELGLSPGWQLLLIDAHCVAGASLSDIERCLRKPKTTTVLTFGPPPPPMTTTTSTSDENAIVVLNSTGALGFGMAAIVASLIVV